MGQRKEHLPVKAFAGIMYREETELNKVLQLLQNLYGPVELKSEHFNVGDFTNYYQPEMGSKIRKVFIAFKNLVSIESLPEMKVSTNKIEQQHLSEGKRVINIDPGYLTEAKIVLATTKDYIHRIYLDKGIFADLHLVYAGKSYQPQKWTYPDYKQEISLNFFNQLRNVYRKQLANF